MASDCLGSGMGEVGFEDSPLAHSLDRPASDWDSGLHWSACCLDTDLYRRCLSFGIPLRFESSVGGWILNKGNLSHDGPAGPPAPSMSNTNSPA